MVLVPILFLRQGTIDPGAKAAIDRMTTAYRLLQSYSAEVQMTNSVGEIAFQRPGKIFVAVKDGKVNPALVDPISRVVSDGVSTYSVSPKRPKSYLKRPTPDEATLLDLAMNSVLQGGFLRYLLHGDDPLQTFTKSNLKIGLKALSKGPAGEFEGVATESVRADLADDSSGQKITVDFEIGIADGLLRRLSMLPQGEVERRVVLETHRNVRVNSILPAATFVFTPSPSAVALTAFDSPFHPSLKPGGRPFPLAAKGLDGKVLDWTELRGKVVLLDFWATWCMPCVASIPHLKALRQAYKAQGFEIVSVSADAAADRAKLTKFVVQHNMEWPQIHDGDARLSNRYAVKAYPTTLLVGRDGRILAVNPQGDDLDAAIARALK